MEYRGYKIRKEDGKVVVENIRDFHPVHVFECGQCFRWLKQPDSSYTGVAKGKVINVRLEEGNLVISNTTIEDFKEIWFDYFDLGRDYAEIKDRLARDEIMKKAIAFGGGIRILRQDFWETVVSFIISANNRIPRIMRTVASISKTYGEEITYNGINYYSFPDVSRLSESNLEELEVCGGGYRCNYIVKTSDMIEKGLVKLDRLKGMSTDDAREELMKLSGVGPKVADCVLLYSGTKADVFPTDVWVKRVMEELYFKRETNFREIQLFARETFGELTGIAQQYLFYYARENRIGAK